MLKGKKFDAFALLKHKCFLQGICLHSSATGGSDNSLTPLTPLKNSCRKKFIFRCKVFVSRSLINKFRRIWNQKSNSSTTF